jgi:predicted transcriptional regulator
MAIGNIDLENSIPYNNRLLNDLSTLTGNALIIYGLLVRHGEGLTTRLLIEKLTSRATDKVCMSNSTRIKSTDTLIKKGFVEALDGNRREGKDNLYKAIPQGNYGLGFTLMSNGAINGAIDRRVTSGELKLYVLLLKYAFGKGSCYPSLHTLSKEIRTSSSNVSHILNRLEQSEYIKREYKLFNGVERLSIKLLV